MNICQAILFFMLLAYASSTSFNKSETVQLSVGELSNLLEDDDQEDEDLPQEHDPLTNKPYNHFSCVSCEPPDCSNVGVCFDAISCYTSQTRDSFGHEERSKGCTKHRDATILFCKKKKYDGRNVHKDKGASGQYVFNCCTGNLCNDGTEWPELPNVPVFGSENSNMLADDEAGLVDPGAISGEVILAISIPIVILIILVAIILFVMQRCHKKRMKVLANSLGLAGFLERGNGEIPAEDELVGLRTQIVGDSTLREFHNDDDMTSGSGSGMPHLVLRTLAKEIELGERIGKGRYGEVWKGRWNGEWVAVKIFYSRDEDSWKRETKIYTTVLLRHDNILGYIGSDCTSQASCTQMWLVTHFYPHGSLYDFLNRDLGGLTSEQAYKLIMSALNGLLHLHTEIFGTQGKPAIAHRDIKSKNILVRDDGTSVIADFGLAVMHSEMDGHLDEDHNSRVGTKRYMSPEVLDQSIDRCKTIEAFRRVDIYAFSLVMWEVLRRTRSNDDVPYSAEEFALPFHNDVGPDPSIEEMRKVVCVDGRRPEFCQHWDSNKFMLNFWTVMQDCWHPNPSVRLSALRMKKTLTKLQSEFIKSEGESNFSSVNSVHHDKYFGISRD